MKSTDKIIRAISQFEAKARSGLDERVRERVYEAFANSLPTPAAEVRPHRWRLIARSRIAQLATAAVIAVTALLGLHLWGLGGAEVYAVEQTIQALRKIETVHAFCTDWKGQKFEMWIKPDPVTGANDFICLAWAEQDCIVISTPYVSYYYYPGRDLVRIVRGQLITSDLDLARMMESLTQDDAQKGDSIEIGHKVTDRYRDVITIHRAGDAFEFEAWISPKTKLLLSLQYTRCNNPGQVSKSLDEIYYNEPVPERLFCFQCPESAVITLEGWGDLDDPNYGINVTGLSDEQACRTILTQLFEAVNAGNLDQIRRLIPIADQWNDESLVAGVQAVIGELWDDQTPGMAAYEIGSPYQDKACPLGVLVPCVLTDHSDQRFEITLIVRFHQADGQRTCVVVDAWGDIKPRLGAMFHRQPVKASDAPFQGPINAGLSSSRATVLIVPTNEADKAIEQRIHDYVRSIQKFLTQRLPNRDIKVLTDMEALEADLSQSSIGIYGTSQGNLWLAKHIAALPIVIEPNSITTDRVYEGSHLRFISAWPHPQNPNLGMVIYTAQRAEDIIGINAIFHGPTDYLIAQGKTVVHSANYNKRNSQWTFE